METLAVSADPVPMLANDQVSRLLRTPPTNPLCLKRLSAGGRLRPVREVIGFLRPLAEILSSAYQFVSVIGVTSALGVAVLKHSPAADHVSVDRWVSGPSWS